MSTGSLAEGEKDVERHTGVSLAWHQVALGQVQALTLSHQGTSGGDLSGHLLLGVV